MLSSDSDDDGAAPVRAAPPLSPQSAPSHLIAGSCRLASGPRVRLRSAAPVCFGFPPDMRMSDRGRVNEWTHLCVKARDVRDGVGEHVRRHADGHEHADGREHAAGQALEPSRPGQHDDPSTPRLARLVPLASRVPRAAAASGETCCCPGCSPPPHVVVHQALPRLRQHPAPAAIGCGRSTAN